MLEIAPNFFIKKENILTARMFQQQDQEKNPNGLWQIAFTLKGEKEPVFSGKKTEGETKGLILGLDF